MSRDLFDTVTHPPAHIGGRSGVTLSLAAHAAALAVIVVVPLIATDVLPIPLRSIGIVMVGGTLPPEPPRPVAPASRPATGRATVSVRLDAPPTITAERLDAPPTDIGDIAPGAFVPGGTGVGADDGRGAGLTPPPPPPAPPAPRPPVHVGGSVTAPARIFDVPPVYPAVPLAARREGLVILQATIGLDGRVEDAQVLRADPLFNEAALTAVRQWRYTPTRLNGQPVAVVMTVTVSFRLR